MISFSPKSPGETRTLVFDFISKLGAGETLVSATVTPTVWSGVDPTPSAIVSGTPSVSGTKAAAVITAGVDGTIYQLACIAVTSASQTLVLFGYLVVQGTPL